MSTVFRNRQRAEEFAALVDGASLPSGASADSRVLLDVVADLRRGVTEDPAASPRPEFALALRERLVTEAATVLAPVTADLRLPVRPRGARERRLAVAASVAVILGGSAGIATAAQGSLPGEALYPVKRGIETVQGQLTGNDAARGRNLLHRADARLDEADALVADGSPATLRQVPATLDAFREQARDGADELLSSYSRTHDEATLNRLRDFTASGLDRVSALSADAPVDARPALRRAAGTLAAIDSDAVGACQACADTPVLTVPSSFVTASDVDRAMAAVRDSHLDNSHPVTVPKDLLRKVADQGVAPAGGTASSPAGGTSGAGGTGSTGSTGSTGPQAPATGPALPSTSPLPVPEVKVRVDVDPDGVTDPVTGTIDKTLDSTLETLLPDGDTGLLGQ